jgi:hypothetical protein
VFIEWQANCYAGCLLMPRRLVYDASGPLAQLKVNTAYIDGELCSVRPDGVTSFKIMQQVSDSGGVFEERRNVSGATTVENSLLHVMDNKGCIAIARVGPSLPLNKARDAMGFIKAAIFPLLVPFASPPTRRGDRAHMFDRLGD